MAVVGSGSLSLHPPPPCFSVLVSPPPRHRPCAHALPVSGSPPTVPVVSKTSGAVYEKALIERYIGQSPPPSPHPASRSHAAEENGTDPISGEPLTKDDLVDVKASECGVPRRPATR